MMKSLACTIAHGAPSIQSLKPSKLRAISGDSLGITKIEIDNPVLGRVKTPNTEPLRKAVETTGRVIFKEDPARAAKKILWTEPNLEIDLFRLSPVHWTHETGFSNWALELFERLCN